jgi:hypothetical protein
LVKIESDDAPAFFIGCSENILADLKIQKNENIFKNHPIRIQFLYK